MNRKKSGRITALTLAALLGPLALCTAHADVYVPNEDTPSVTVYATGAVGNAAPIRTLAGPNTGFVSGSFEGPSGITTDTVNNELYVVEFQPERISVFDLNANGNVAPLRTLIEGASSGLAQPRTVAVDTAHNEIIVANFQNSIRTYARTASGDAAPLRTIAGPATLMHNPSGAVLDAAHDEIIVGSDVGGAGNSVILVFNRTDSGNVAPKRAITGSTTDVGWVVAYDPAAEEIFSSAYGSQSVTVFDRTANGNVAPKRRLSGPATGLTGASVSGLMVDTANQRLSVVLDKENAILVFDLKAEGNTPPLMRLAGPLTGLNWPQAIAMDSQGGLSGGGAPPQPSAVTAVPTLGEWALMLLGALLAAVGLRRIGRAGRPS